MSSRLFDRIKAAQRTNFVGRQAEQAVFRGLLEQPQLPYNVLHIYGPGGIGKTTLLKKFADICAEASAAAAYLDARNIEPSPPAFTTSLCLSLGIEPSASALDHLAAEPGTAVILVDTYENLAPLDDWLRTSFFIHLPENTLLVLAGRLPPAPAWRSDPGWQELVRVLPLRNLTPDESRVFLERRAIPEQQRQSVLAFTHGHPLALSLVADVFAQRPGFEFVPEETPDIIKTLVEQFIQKAPGPAHRAALEACSLVRVTTEALLARMLAAPDAHELFDWLRSLSFVESRRGGIFPHDLARDALISDLRWRNPDWYAELHRRARAYYLERLEQTGGLDQQRTLWDFIFLHRDNPAVRPYFEWQTSLSLLSDRMRQDDLPALLEMVRQHEGAESARLAGFWLARQPDKAIVLRDSNGTPTGFFAWIELNTLSDSDLEIDPAVRSCWDYLSANAPLRQGEVAAFFRFWMAADSYQDVSPAQSILFVNIVRYYLATPGLAFTFLYCAAPDFWMPGLAYGDIHRLPEADFSLGQRRFGMFGHDWRACPPLAWLELMAEREIATAPLAASPAQRSEPVLVLSQEEFSSAVREALRSFSQPASLHQSLLLRSRLVLGEGSSPETERIQKLRAFIQRAADTLHSNPRSEKYYRALDKTYFHPAPTQEIAAEVLDVPFSTYRRHLKSGIEAVVDQLWQQEIGL